MSNFYTNVICVGNNILYRGVENGRRVKLRVGYTPTMFLPSKKETKWKTLHGEYLDEVPMGSIRDCRDFIKRYEDVENFKIYGIWCQDVRIGNAIRREVHLLNPKPTRNFP